MDMRETFVLVGERIRNARRRAKLSQGELSRRIGYSTNGVAKIERGESDPKLSTLVRIAGALFIEASDLVDLAPGVPPRWGTLDENRVARSVRRRINNHIRSEVDERLARGMSMDEALNDMVATGRGEEDAQD